MNKTLAVKPLLYSIAEEVYNKIYTPQYMSSATVFLCGASLNDHNKYRYRISQVLSKHSWVEVLYPEDIFQGLLYSNKAHDLMTLENMLADNVHAIILTPESPGSFAELGAFSNNERLRQKMYCIVDVKYARKKSFINRGPLALLQRYGRESVEYCSEYDVEVAVEKILPFVKKLRRRKPDDARRIPLLQLENYLLPCVYCAQPLTKVNIIAMVSCINNDSLAYAATVVAIDSLTRKKMLQLTSNGYIITDYGIKKFMEMQKIGTKASINKRKEAIDDLVLNVYNSTLRRKYA